MNYIEYHLMFYQYLLDGRHYKQWTYLVYPIPIPYNIGVDMEYTSMFARRGEGGSSPLPKPKKIVGEKWCYFPELYKMTEVREEG